MVTCWANPTADNVRGIQRFPALPADQVDLVKSIGKWNGKLKERGVGREIVAVAQHKITLTAV